ncbi:MULTISPECIES: glycosyltransferase family 4 protein [unclassified Arenibacter]|jgi:glycosyltransferase involved in cell wall biosynthesis|uniref:glycosyltransferase family 4 protein n=1 Tax=unclassified Arenibacter TaxID=2615047 RepID=UPI000E3530F0|nr:MULTISPECIES: glycosyltransferase family 4 protein [unclassified Arenibacter]MCM4164773.1 glycosyltransferase WbuB [Arenibacter sp. A80]RFT55841.1 glycosyltransferase WbuB [Arenibacter sp. P308M17]
MRVIFLGLAVPNMNEYHNMFTELVVEFRNNGHDIMVVAPTYDETVFGMQIEDGIPTLRVPTLELFGVGKIQKGLATLLLPYQYKRALKKANIDLNFDLVMMPTPPITLVNVASWLKRKYGSKMYLILRDIFPQNALDLGMMNPKGLAYAYFRKKEKEMYYASDYIGCMSPGNIDYVKKHNPEQDASKLHLLPNWAWLQPNLEEQEIIRIKEQYGLLDKFIVVFGGNIGKPQKMENIVALAKSCITNKDLFFLIIGGGNEKEHLDKMILQENLSNVRVKDFLSREEFFKVLQIADVGLISLSEHFTIPNIPSKSLVYFNAKVPILASVDLNTDFGTHLESIGAGLWAEAGKTEILKEKLMQLYNNPDKKKEMGENGYQYFKNNLLASMAYERIFTQVTALKKT